MADNDNNDGPRVTAKAKYQFMMYIPMEEGSAERTTVTDYEDDTPPPPYELPPTEANPSQEINSRCDFFYYLERESNMDPANMEITPDLLERFHIGRDFPHEAPPPPYQLHNILCQSINQAEERRREIAAIRDRNDRDLALHELPSMSELEIRPAGINKTHRETNTEPVLDQDTEIPESFPYLTVHQPVTKFHIMFLLLEAALSTGILGMPKAFQSTGICNAIIFITLVNIACVHCSQILEQSSFVLYIMTGKIIKTYPEVAQAAFQNGPLPLRKCAKAFTNLITFIQFLTYFVTSSVYIVIMAENLQQVIAYCMRIGEKDLEIRFVIIVLLPPLIFISWIRKREYIVPLSMITHVFMALSLSVTVYYLVSPGVLKINDFTNTMFKSSDDEWLQVFYFTIFALQSIFVVMPIPSPTENPPAIGLCNDINKGASVLTFGYIVFGSLEYLRYGEAIKDCITLNLDSSQGLAQYGKVATTIAVFCTFGLQIFVCVEFLWSAMKCTEISYNAEFTMRTIVTTSCAILAILVPSIGDLMGIMTAYCFSILGLIAPAIIEVITNWEFVDITYHHIIFKDVIMVLLGFFTLIFGNMKAGGKILQDWPYMGH